MFGICPRLYSRFSTGKAAPSATQNLGELRIYLVCCQNEVMSSRKLKTKRNRMDSDMNDHKALETSDRRSKEAYGVKARVQVRARVRIKLPVHYGISLQVG
jgi:hypothetical protein